MSLEELKTLSTLLDNTLTPFGVGGKENGHKSNSGNPSTPTGDHGSQSKTKDDPLRRSGSDIKSNHDDPEQFMNYPAMYGDFSDTKPWKKDPHYFKKSYISSLALLKMTIHAQRGGSIEIMGMLVGKIIQECIIVMDVYPLPVEGTETRVNAQAEGYEYMVQYLECNKRLPIHSQENIVGWYHSHPGYGCWLSGIDVATQATNQNFQDPYLAIVIDPLKTLRQRKVEIGAFRTFPDNYTPSKAITTRLNGGPNLPKSKRKDFGAHSDRYYSLDIEIFNNKHDDGLIKEILHNEDQKSIVWLNNLMINKASSVDQDNTHSHDHNYNHNCIHGKLDKNKVIKGSNLLHNFDIVEVGDSNEIGSDNYNKNNINLVKLNKKLLEFEKSDTHKIERTFESRFNKLFEYQAKRVLDIEPISWKSKGSRLPPRGFMRVPTDLEGEGDGEDREGEEDDEEEDDEEDDDDDEDDVMDESDLEKETQGVSDEGDDDAVSVDSSTDVRAIPEENEDQDMDKSELRRSSNSGLTLNLGNNRRDQSNNKPRRISLNKEKKGYGGTPTSFGGSGQPSPLLRRSLQKGNSERISGNDREYFNQERFGGFGFENIGGGGSSSSGSGSSGSHRAYGGGRTSAYQDNGEEGNEGGHNYRVRASAALHNKNAISFTKLSKYIGQQEINKLIVQDVQSQLFL